MLDLHRRSAHAHLLCRRGDRRSAVATQPNADAGARHAGIGEAPSRAAHADAPFALAPQTGLRLPLLPAKALRAIGVGLGKRPLGEGRPGKRMPFGFVAQAQFDRVDPHLMREFVDRAFDREGADRLAGRTHERVGHDVEVEVALDDLEALRAVEARELRLYCSGQAA